MIRSRILDQFKGIVYGVSTVNEGNMSLRAAIESEDQNRLDNIKKSREIFLSKLNIKAKSCVSAKLNGHTDRIVEVESVDKGDGMFGFSLDAERDGLITRSVGVGLFMVSADCPIAIFYDPIQRVLGMAHFSWVTTDKRLPEKMVNRLAELRCEPANMQVFIGPGIKKESYRFNNPAQKMLPAWKSHITDLPNGETAIDINSYQVEQLLGVDVLKNHIEVSAINTATDKNYFSHYRSVRTGEPEGRFGNVAIMLD